MKVLQINTTLNTGSTGRIAEEIGQALIADNHSSYIAHGRAGRPSQSQTIKIGHAFDQQLHGVQTRIFDTHAFASGGATRQLIKQVKHIDPDIIHLHNLHGYYLHAGVLFDFLKERKKPVVWTLHDCWSFTGHCSYFDFVGCDKWKTHCHQCPLKKRYPESYVVDNSYNNFDKKKAVFNGVENLTLVTPSKWLRNLLQLSFLKNYPVSVINNGINLQQFSPMESGTAALKNKLGIKDETVVLGVASVWDRRKGLKDFIALSSKLPPGTRIILLGLTAEQQKELPTHITALERTESLEEMVQLYNLATVFVNPTWVDNFPTTNIEALACGTPVITYNTGGSIEAIDEHTGLIVEKGDIDALAAAIETIRQKDRSCYSEACRQRAVRLYNNMERNGDYIRLYQQLLNDQQQSTQSASWE